MTVITAMTARIFGSPNELSLPSELSKLPKVGPDDWTLDEPSRAATRELGSSLPGAAAAAVLVPRETVDIKGGFAVAIGVSGARCFSAALGAASDAVVVAPEPAAGVG